MRPVVMHNDGLSACRFYARWHFFIPGFAVTNYSTIAVSRFRIDRLLILEVLQDVILKVGQYHAMPCR